MLRRIVLSLVPAAIILVAAPAHSAVAVGQNAPDFALKDASGKTVKLSDFKGKHVVLEWTNPGCPFVVKHYDSGNMPATQKEAIAKGVVWLSINSTEKGSADFMEPVKLAAWQKDKQAPATMLMDEDGVAGKAYGARTTPHMYIVNPQGQLIYAGGIDSIPSASPADIPKATNYIKQGLTQALAGKPLNPASTQPYGCSVKYKS
jgi:AhpC/TSA family